MTWQALFSNPPKFFHVASSKDRDSIATKGLMPSVGWSSGSGVFITTNPESWFFMFDEDGIYATEEIDVWSVDVSGYVLVPDDNETADPEEDFFVRHRVPVDRIRLRRGEAGL